MGLLIGHDADGPASQTRIAAEESFAGFRLVLRELACVDEARYDGSHVILARGVQRHQIVYLFGRMHRFSRFRALKWGAGAATHQRGDTSDYALENLGPCLVSFSDFLVNFYNIPRRKINCCDHRFVL